MKVTRNRLMTLAGKRYGREAFVTICDKAFTPTAESRPRIAERLVRMKASLAASYDASLAATIGRFEECLARHRVMVRVGGDIVLSADSPEEMAELLQR